MAGVELWCRVTIVGREGEVLARWVLEGSGAPDIGAVDVCARLALLAGRLGGNMVVAQLSPALRALLELSGLRVEVEGQAELGE
jgi:hypothetical protein